MARTPLRHFTARYLLLAAIHRICQPGPKTDVADWYRRTILHSVWGIPPERFTSQAFWDAFEKILPEHLDPLATGWSRAYSRPAN